MAKKKVNLIITFTKGKTWDAHLKNEKGKEFGWQGLICNPENLIFKPTQDIDIRSITLIDENVQPRMGITITNTLDLGMKIGLFNKLFAIKANEINFAFPGRKFVDTKGMKKISLDSRPAAVGVIKKRARKKRCG
jgi:hypothetical protein